jgi:SAM-dependent methyltransferase
MALTFEYAVNNAPDEVKSYWRRVNVENDVLPFQEEFFDLIISLATFEHLHFKKNTLALSEICRVLKTGGLLIINVPNPYNKVEAEKLDHITMLSKKGWIELIEKLGLHYESKLSRVFDATRIKEIAALYTLSHHSFQFMGMHLYFSGKVKTLVAYLLMLKRRLFAPKLFTGL